MGYIKVIITTIFFLIQSSLVAMTIYQPADRTELKAAVDLWVSDEASALSQYGDINMWDVSLVTTMESLFNGKSTFNSDISNWDLSNVINLRYMFYNASAFNQDISSWNVSSVTNIQNIFMNATSFNQNGNPS